MPIEVFVTAPLLKDLKISSEADVWKALQDFATNSMVADDVKLVFDNFPNLEVKFEGAHFQSSIPIRVMHSLAVLQDEVHRLYCLVVYDNEKHQLSQEEKDSLEIFFRVSSGSSNVKPENIYEVLNNISLAAVGKIGKREVMVLSLIAAVAWGSVTHLGKMEEEATRRANDRIELERSKEETKRMEIITSLVKENIKFKKAIESGDRFTESIAKSVKRNEKVTLPDSTEITEVVAKELYPKSKRRKASDFRMDGEYFVDRFDMRIEENRVEFYDGDGKHWVATVPPDNAEMMNAFYEGVGKIMFLKINGRDFEGEVRDLTVIEAQVVVQQAKADKK